MTIVNSGYFKNDDHNKIEVPSKMVKIGQKPHDVQYYTLECDSEICPTTAIISDYRSECANNIFKAGSSEHCRILTGPSDEICSIHEIKGLGSLISATQAEFYFDSDTNPFKQISIKKENRILVNEGNLVCKNIGGQKLESRFISAPSLHSTKIGYINKTMSLIGMKFEETNSALSDNVSELKIMTHSLKLDYLSKTGYSLPTLIALVIGVCILTQFFIFGLCLFVCYRRNRKAIDKKMYKL